MISHSDSRALIEGIRALAPKQQSSDKTSGTVTRVDDDGTIWVRFAGSQASTPCARSIVAASPGDTVSIAVQNGKATIDGNFTTPSTDNSEAQKALQKAIALQVIATGASKAASDAVKAAEQVKSLADAANKAAQEASAAVTPILTDLGVIKGGEESFLAGLDKHINTMTAEFASSQALVDMRKELETSISQTAERIEMVASSDTALQLSAEAQALLAQANTDLHEAKTELDSAQMSYGSALAHYNELAGDSDTAAEDLAAAEQALSAAQFELQQAQAAYDDIVSIITGIKTNYTSKAEFEFMAQGLRLLFSDKTDDSDKTDVCDSYITMTKKGIRLGEIGNASAYLNIASNMIAFVQNGNAVATIKNDAMSITRVKTTDELAINDWHWKQRENGNISFKYRKERADG